MVVCLKVNPLALFKLVVKRLQDINAMLTIKDEKLNVILMVVGIQWI